MAKMTTYTGKEFIPSQIQLEDICIEDIAHHLSMLCRWGGAVHEFYSVAQHSVRVSYLCNLEDALWGLLHDAAEAYTGDIIRPVKDDLGRFGPALRVIEDAIMLQICRKYNLGITMPESVKEADNRAWKEERDALIQIGPLPAASRPFYCCIPQPAVKVNFLNRFYELTEK